MADIAALAGVSIATVSRALQDNKDIAEDVRARVKAIAAEQGYAVNQSARNLRSQSTKTIGIVLPLGHETGQQLTDPFFLEFIGCLAEEVMKRRYDILLSKIPQPEPNWLSLLVQSHRFDGLLVIGQSDQHETIDAVASKYLPMVVWGEKLPGQHYCSVGVDNVAGGQLATEYLLSAGSHNPLFLGPQKVPEVESRYRGFVEGLKAASIKTPQGRAIEAHLTQESAYETVKDLLRNRRKFDGLVCASDVIAAGAIEALQEAGLSVPDDVNVCGYDDVAMARTFTPPLTTIKQDMKLGAQFMVQMLFERLEGNRSSSAVLPANLIVRKSTRRVQNP
jgi:DNA-binding LacI/PurR family transcriptional regulator